MSETKNLIKTLLKFNLKNPFRKKSKKEQYTIAFYNVENLFDTRDGPAPLDSDFTPNAKMRWNTKRYDRKLNNIAKVIATIGTSQNNYPPIVIGLAEVENETVLQDLISTDALKSLGYGYVHYDSPDERGIDTAFLYRKKFINIRASKSHQLYVENPEGIRDFTRDILQVSCEVLGEDISFLINHWPSRRDGSTSTEHKRLTASAENAEILKGLQRENPSEQFMVMGDFNDDPQNQSIQNLMGFGLYNPMEKLLTNLKGTTKYKGQWNLFDQILISYSFLKPKKGTLYYEKAGIYDPDFLKQQRGRYKGTPHRTFGGQNYTGGYSDHFPVFVVLERT